MTDDAKAFPTPAALVLSLALLFAQAALPCSLVSSGIGEPVLAADGLVHWTASAGRASSNWTRPPSYDHAYWITHTSLGAEPEAQLIEAPAIREGRPSLIGALPDGSSWWRAPCSDWDPPATVACHSLLLVGPAGEPLGRVSSRRRGRLFLEGDGTLLSLEAGGGSDTARRMNAGSQPATRHTLQLWQGTPLTLQTFDQPANNAWWHDDYQRREESFPREGWELMWEAQFPFPYRERYDRIIWTLNRQALDRRGGPLVAAVVGQRERIFAGVYSVKAEPGRGPEARLEALWQREYPRARNGLSEDENGDFALAPPWSIALSSRGELAMANWAIHGDCSRDRPAGFVVLDDEGEVLADVRHEETQWRIEGVTFDREDRLVVARSEISNYTVRGELLGTAPRAPTAWQEEAERQLERARALSATSPLEEWVELYHLLERLPDDPRNERQALADRLLVDGWPQLEPVLPDPLWLELGQRFCAAHAEAAQAALQRFEAAWGEAKELWLVTVAACFDEPPRSASAIARRWLELRNPSKREAAKSALSRWPTPTDLGDELWRQVVAAESSSDHQERYAATEMHAQLLMALPHQRQELEARLRAGGDDRRAAISVLFSSFPQFGVYASRDEPVREALLDAARVWAAADDEDLNVIGTLLLMGHAGLVQARTSRPDSPAPVPAPEPGPIDRMLLEVLDHSRSQRDDLPLWATVAVSRLLLKHATRSPFDARGLQLPTPEQVGLQTDLMAFLLATAKSALDAKGAGAHRFPPHSELEEARFFVLRSLGETGRETLLGEYRALERSDPRARARLWQLVSWMAQDLEPWDEADVRFVLQRTDSGSNNGGELALILDEVVRAYPADHELHRMARAIFRGHVEEAVALAGDLPSSRRSSREPSRASLPQMISHLVELPSSRNELSPLLGELTTTDAEAIAGGARSGFDPWLSLMGVTGPWPAAVPELERMLEGNNRFQAAVALSHRQHPKALEVLLTGGTYYFSQPVSAQAIARYGTAGVETLVELLASHPEDEPQSKRRRQATVALLVELMISHPDPVRQVSHSERFATARENVRREVEEALERGAWPDGASIVWLDVFESKASGTGPIRPSDGADLDSALGRALSAIDRLPTDADSVRSFLFQSGDRVSNDLLKRLAELAGDVSHPLRQAVLAMMQPLADEGVEAARWVIRGG